MPRAALHSNLGWSSCRKSNFRFRSLRRTPFLVRAHQTEDFPDPTVDKTPDKTEDWAEKQARITSEAS